MSYQRVMQRGLLALGLLAAMLAGPRSVRAIPTDPPGPAPSPIPPEGAVVRIHLASREQVPLLASLGVDIWRLEQEEMLLVGTVDAQLYRQLLKLGFFVEIDEERTQQLLVPPGYPCYRTVEEILDHMVAVSNAYPELTELYDYGDSWEKTQDPEQGYDILAIRITNEAITGAKPVLLIVSTHHAREMVVPELPDFFIDYLTGGFRGEGGYGIDPDVTWLVDHREIWIVPLVNPDGRKMVEPSGWWWRKNTNDTDNPGCAWPPTPYDHYGVDNNRNFPYMWAYDDSGSSSDPCVQGYRGVSPASEPETQAVMALGNALFPDPDDDTGIMMTLHSAVPAILIPWSYANPSPAPDDAALRAIGCKWATYNNYPVGRPGEVLWYYPNGTTDDWFYGELDVASFTPEIGDDFFEPCWGDEFPWDIWEDNLPTYIHAAKVAAPDPYLTVYGPDAHSLVVSPDPVAPGEPVQLSATLEDIRLLNQYCDDQEQPVAGAEYFIDAPGADGTGTPLVPYDGAWDETAELAEATVDTTGLELGTHYVLVHGLSDGGHWGPFTAVFVHVQGEPCEAVEEVQIDGPTFLLAEETGVYTATTLPITATQPVTLTWDNGTVGATAAYSWTADGVYTVTVAALNACSAVSAALAVEVCQPVTGLEITGPLTLTVGQAGVYAAATIPLTPTLPVVLLWSNGTRGPQAIYSWGAAGIYTVSLRASNACGVADRALAVRVVSNLRMLYLPLLMRGFESS
ncbi:MAG: hypothetical protein JW900_03870 [Anaerolineae bacterium]|nr:hypothetical protein [Anaerolineae bacterium]